MALPEPRTEAGRAGLAALLAKPAGAVIALDFDGTLAPIVVDPTTSRPQPGALDALRRLAPLVGSVVVVTGRPALVAVEYGGFATTEGLGHMTVLGHYGLERWDAASGAVSAPPPNPGVRAATAALPAVLAAAGAPAGVVVEDKHRSVAVHTRRAEDPRRALESLRAPLASLAGEHGLVVEPGRHVLELRPPGVDKGAALDVFLTERPVSSVLYAGDDLGDLAAFEAVGRARARGLAGVTVCSGSTEVTELASRADLVVAGPAGVVELLAGLATALGG